MESFSIDGIIATTILDTRRAKKVTDPDVEIYQLYPVKYRINYNAKQFYYPAGIDMTSEDWELLPTTKKRDLLKTKELIQAGFEKIKDHIKDLFKNEGFSIEGLRKRLSRGRTDSLLNAFDNKIASLKESGQIGTMITYQCALKSITAFTNRDLKLADITVDWLKKYENHLYSEEKTTSTIKFYMGCIRALMNEAKQDNIINESGYPFGKGKFEIKRGIGRKLALTLPQIKAVLEYPLLTANERRMRDLWFFSYLCNGINFNDMLKLKFKNIAGGEIHWIRQKTKRTSTEQKEIVATLLPEMKAIIKSWGNKKKPDNYIFPFLRTGLTPAEEKLIIQNVVRLVNKKMVKISKALKFDPISTYTARHSYATVLKRSGANIAFISESLGHTDLRTTENYLASFESEERAKNAAKLLQFE